MSRGLLLPLVMMITSCTGLPLRGDFELESMDLTMTSRGAAVPVTLVVPNRPAGQASPLIVMAHGHGGSRHEGGGYEQVARAFAERGIASIRMDFPGCGDSTEPFTENNLSNMIDDMQAARDFAAARAAVDSARVGLLGYSMGGRVVTLLSQIDPSYKAMALWTPAVSPGVERVRSSLGGSDTYYRLREKANRTGIATYTTRWGTELSLGPRWFTDMENSTPLDAVARFRGPLMVLYGDRDDVVPPEVSEAALRAAANADPAVRHVVADADHALGFYDNRAHIASEVVQTTADFFAVHL